jgi:heme O synthase-like polyprenyltransferase
MRLWIAPSTRSAWGMFRFSIYYLALLFIAAAADVLLRF